jgi:hypothetical protein
VLGRVQIQRLPDVIAQDIPVNAVGSLDLDVSRALAHPRSRWNLSSNLRPREKPKVMSFLVGLIHAKIFLALKTGIR